MASSTRGFLRRRQEKQADTGERPVFTRRALTASAQRINLGDRSEAARYRQLRQGWQEDAWAYVDGIPELSYALRFKGNACSRMRIFAGMIDPADPDGPPIPIEKSDAPPAVVSSALAAMNSLGVGRLQVAPMLNSLSWSFDVAGECYLVGSQDLDTNEQAWTIRSVDEVMVTEDKFKLREVPLDPQGTQGWIDLEPENTFVSRLWVPHPRFQKMANSPMRAMLDKCEQYLLLDRDVRATARSRAATAGFLKVPDGLRVQSFFDDNNDPNADDTVGSLIDALMTPIADDGVASSVVPIIITGSEEALAQFDHLIVDRPYSAIAVELRAECIGSIATGVDLPREVLEGMADMNHWSAWQVDDNTFRHHIEPAVITQVDSLTLGFMRPWMQADSDLGLFEAEWVQRVVIWYDPVELVTSPDRTQDAMALHKLLVISDAALRKAAGFDDTDAPSALEIELRMLRTTRTYPPELVLALFHQLDPTLSVPAIDAPGTMPGMGPKGAVPVELPAGPAELTPPGAPGEPVKGPPAIAPPPPAVSVISEAMAARQAASSVPVRLSRKLAISDQQLRAQIQVAANAAMLKLLERAGAKLRTRAKDRRYRNLRAQGLIESVPNALVASALGRRIVVDLGFANSGELLNPDWGDLQQQFMGWTRTTQSNAIRTAAQLAGLTTSDESVQAADGALAVSAGRAWDVLETALGSIAENLLYNPAPSTDASATIDPDTLVPMGTIRTSVAVAGGYNLPAEDVASVAGPGSQTIGAAVGQIGTGQTITDLLTSSDNVDQAGYEWVHGPALHPFDPHDELDGVQFSSFTDDALANDTGFPDNEYYLPGDHDGCSCDFVTLWAPVQQSDDGNDQESDEDSPEGEDA